MNESATTRLLGATVDVPITALDAGRVMAATACAIDELGVGPSGRTLIV